VCPTEAYGATDEIGQTFPWVKSAKKWWQNIRTSKSVLDNASVDFVTSGNKQYF